MKRSLRLALAGGLAAAAFGSMAPSAHAFRCAPDFQFICTTYAKACQYVPHGDKVDPHQLLCESLA